VPVPLRSPVGFKSWSNREANRLKAFGIKAIGGRVKEQRSDQYVLREEPVAYNSVFDPEKGLLSSENSYFWGVNF
jgi:hypothetical protein